jgi:gas vesicle protein
MGDNSNDFGAFLAGFVIGGLVGAATALLLAPQSGEETRTVIRDKSIELKDKASVSTAEARARAEASLREAQARYDALTQQAKDTTDDLLKRGQVVLEEQKAKVEGVITSRKKPPTEDASEV